MVEFYLVSCRTTNCDITSTAAASPHGSAGAIRCLLIQSLRQPLQGQQVPAGSNCLLDTSSVNRLEDPCNTLAGLDLACSQSSCADPSALVIELSCLFIVPTAASCGQTNNHSFISLLRHTCLGWPWFASYCISTRLLHGYGSTVPLNPLFLQHCGRMALSPVPLHHSNSRKCFGS